MSQPSSRASSGSSLSQASAPTRLETDRDSFERQVREEVGAIRERRVPARIRAIAQGLPEQDVETFLQLNSLVRIHPLRRRQDITRTNVDGGYQQIMVPHGRDAVAYEVDDDSEILRAYLYRVSEMMDFEIEDRLLHRNQTENLYKGILNAGKDKYLDSGDNLRIQREEINRNLYEFVSDRDLDDITLSGSEESEESEETQAPGPDQPGGPKQRTVFRNLAEEFEEEAEREEGLTGQQIDQLEQQEGILMTAGPVDDGHGEEEKDALVDESEIVSPQETALGQNPIDLGYTALTSGPSTPSGPGVQGSGTPLTQGQMQAQIQAGQQMAQIDQGDIANLGDFEEFDLDFHSDDSIAEGSGVSSEPRSAPSAGQSTITGSGMTTISSAGSGMTTITGSGTSSGSAGEPTIMGSESSGPPSVDGEVEMEEGQRAQASSPSTRRTSQRSYPNPIHADSLGLFFYDAFNPQWDTELFKDRLRRFGSIKGIPAKPFYNQSKMIVDKFGPDLLIESLKFGPTDSLSNVFKENHEVLQLYFSLRNPHTGTRSKTTTGTGGATQTVGVPLGELAAFRGLIAGQRQPGFDVRGRAQAGFNQAGQEAPATTAAPASTPDAESDLRVMVPEPEWVTKLRGKGVRIEQRNVWKSNPVYHSSEFIDSMRRARTNVEDTERPYSLEKATELDQTVQDPTDKAGSIMRMAAPGEICQTLYGVSYDF